MINRRNVFLGAIAVAAIPSVAAAANMEKYKDMLLCNIPLRERGGKMRTCTIKFRNYTGTVCPEFMDILTDVYQMDIHDLANSIHTTWPKFRMISLAGPRDVGGRLILGMVNE